MADPRSAPLDSPVRAGLSPGAGPIGLTASSEEPARAARNPIVRYVGFESTERGREYTMQVSEGLSSRRFVLLISHQAFAAHEARFQDAPDLCSGKLRQELAADPDLAPDGPMALTTRDLLDYRDAHDRSAPTRKRASPKT